MATVLLSFAVAIAQEISCEHQWIVEDKEGVQQKVELENVNDKYHLLITYSLKSVCSECGEQSFQNRNYTYMPHSYLVEGWSFENDKCSVNVTWQCCICGHVLSEVISMNDVLAGSLEWCLYGGECENKLSGYLHKDGYILPEGGAYLPGGVEVNEKEYMIAIIYDPNNMNFHFSHRTYCATCGRPYRLSTSSPTPMFNENWNGLPIMTEEYFLTVDMPENLPYQLIDQLRKEAGAA